MKLLTLSKYIISLCILVVVVGCKPKAEVPVQFAEADIEVNIYPDYKDIVVPPNIAPLNFIVRDSIATAYVVQFTGKGQELHAAADDAVFKPPWYVGLCVLQSLRTCDKMSALRCFADNA